MNRFDEEIEEGFKARDGKEMLLITVFYLIGVNFVEEYVISVNSEKEFIDLVRLLRVIFC